MIRPLGDLVQTAYETTKKLAIPLLAAASFAFPTSLYAHPHDTAGDTTADTDATALKKKRTLKDAYFGRPLDKHVKSIMEATNSAVHEDLDPQLAYSLAVDILWAQKRTPNPCLTARNLMTDEEVKDRIDAFDYNKDGVIAPAEYQKGMPELAEAQKQNPILAMYLVGCLDMIDESTRSMLELGLPIEKTPDMRR